jgi:phage terminase large subunit-like protein
VAGIDLEEWRTWDRDSQRVVMNALEAASKGSGQVWYCSRGRSCDGRGHEGVPYEHARGDQWPPPGVDWFLWLVMSGRGAGKTRTGAEWTRKISRYVERSAMVARRGTDVRATMVEGESGLIPVCERAGIGYLWEPSKKEFTFDNGHKVFGYSAEEPDALRGPQHGAAWLDEPAHMLLIEEVWDNLLFGLRLPGLPGGAKALATTTPLPIRWVKERIREERTVMVRVSTEINLHNLDDTYKRNVIARYEGTRKGRQELHGELLEDLEGALWTTAMIDDNRAGAPEQFERIVVAVDPAGTSTKRSDETGIVVVGTAADEFWVLEDASGKYTPNAWASRVARAYTTWSADRVVAEKNYGGDMVESTLRNSGHKNLPITLVNSRRGKALRAEPVAALYERHLVHHLRTEALATLEEQMTTWIPGQGDSPDRVDALVHGLTDLAGTQVGEGRVAKPGGRSMSLAPAIGPKRPDDEKMRRGIRHLLRR